jgi:hypothetical protein
VAANTASGWMQGGACAVMLDALLDMRVCDCYSSSSRAHCQSQSSNRIDLRASSLRLDSWWHLSVAQPLELLIRSLSMHVYNEPLQE